MNAARLTIATRSSLVAQINYIVCLFSACLYTWTVNSQTTILRRELIGRFVESNEAITGISRFKRWVRVNGISARKCFSFQTGLLLFTYASISLRQREQRTRP